MKNFEFTVGQNNFMRHLLVFDIAVLENRLQVIITYNSHLFRSDTIEALSNALEEQVSQMLADLLPGPVSEEASDVTAPPSLSPGRTMPVVRICKTCILPDSFPHISFDENGICNYCRDHGTKKEDSKSIHFDTEEQIIQCMEKFRDPDRRYDVLVPLSGGVDSSAAMINIMEKYKLKPLGWHNDHGYEDPAATENVKKLCKALDVDLIVQQHDMAFMRKLWRYTQEASGVGISGCFVCGGILYANALELAGRFDIPMIINGYSKGQAEMMGNKRNALDAWEQLIVKFQEDPLFFKEFLNRQKPMSRQKVVLSRQDLEKEPDPKKILVLPFYLFRQNNSDKEALKQLCISRFDWKQIATSFPSRTTNCEMVWLNTFFDIRKMNYTMYHQEYASLIRKGEITRDQALANLDFNPPDGLVDRLAHEVGLAPGCCAPINFRAN